MNQLCWRKEISKTGRIITLENRVLPTPGVVVHSCDFSIEHGLHFLNFVWIDRIRHDEWNRNEWMDSYNFDFLGWLSLNSKRDKVQHRSQSGLQRGFTPRRRKLILGLLLCQKRPIRSKEHITPTNLSSYYGLHPQRLWASWRAPEFCTAVRLQLG